MGELVDLQAVEKWFRLLAVILPLLGIAIGAALQFRSRRPGALVTGILIGLLGPANWLLWRIYNRIEDHYGLDSVKAMLINLALFAVLGITIGLIYRFSRRPQPQPAGPERLNT
jgi:drug/metabolite transporter (DMT)-like permease